MDRVGDLPGWETAPNAGFEFRLGVSEAATDFGVAIIPGHPLLDYYICQGEATEPNSPLSALGRFLTRMAATASEPPVGDWFTSAMLEYDIAEPPSGARPDPGIFLRLNYGTGARRPAPSLPTPSEMTAQIADAVGWNSSEDERRAVEQVVAPLPANGEVAHIGAIPGRGVRAVRLIARNVEAEEVPPLLERLSWTGPVRKVMDSLESMRNVCPRSRLALDVTADGPVPRLGLEMFPPGERSDMDNWLTTGRNNWRPIVERLKAKEWCLPNKGRRLLEFPGLDKIFDQRGVFILYRGLNHVKLTIEGESVQAKAYAGLRFFRLNPGPNQ